MPKIKKPKSKSNKITWNTDVNAPCCPGEIVHEDGRTLLIQTDWDYPGTANTFGWSTRSVQRCKRKGCKHLCTEAPKLELGDTEYVCEGCGKKSTCCHHDGTDGTVDCRECGVTATEFISAAYDWLIDNDGAEAEDPGYFG